MAKSRVSGSSTSGSSANSAPERRSSKTLPAGKNSGCARCGPVCDNSAIEPLPTGCLPVTSGRPTAERGSSSWPTPQARDWKGKSGAKRHSPQLPDAVRLWLTPRYSHDAGKHRGKADGLHSADKESPGLWPSPTAQMAKHATPSAYELSAARLAKGQLHASVSAASSKPGPLNPTWVEALMGFPLGFTDLGPPDPTTLKRTGSRPARR